MRTTRRRWRIGSETQDSSHAQSGLSCSDANEDWSLVCNPFTDAACVGEKYARLSRFHFSGTLLHRFDGLARPLGSHARGGRRHSPSAYPRRDLPDHAPVYRTASCLARRAAAAGDERSFCSRKAFHNRLSALSAFYPFSSVAKCFPARSQPPEDR